MPYDDAGSFLRARRALLQPGDVGLPVHGRRRVPGLRREEVALLAGVSADYYSKIEQGQGSGASDSVLDAISDTLRLDVTARAHLRHLVRGTGRPVPVRRTRATAASVRVRPAVRRLIASMPDVPAVVVGPAMDNLAWNELADALFGITAMEEAGFGTAQYVFLAPEARLRYPDWETTAREVVGYLRFSTGRAPDDPAANALVGELSVKSAEFRSLWARQTVHDKTHGRKRLTHSVVGGLELDYESFRISGTTGQLLVTFTAETGSATKERLRLLASWAATEREGDAGLAPGTRQLPRPDA